MAVIFMKEQLIEISKDAGAQLLEMFRKGAGTEIVKEKNGLSPAIAADIAVERSIISAIRRTNFNGRIISEEAGEIVLGDGTQVVHLDPLDGSRNFARGIRHFCVSIGVAEGAKPVLGIVYNPNLGELFVADAKESGFTMNGEQVRYASDGVRIVSATEKEVMGRVSLAGNGGENRDLRIRFHGSAALDLCDVACNRYDAAIITRSFPHDVAAGMLVAQKAGAAAKEFDARTDASIFSREMIVSSDQNLICRLSKILSR